MRPDVDIPALLDGPGDVLGERIVRYVLEAWERPETRKRGIMLVRAGLGNRLATPLLSEFLQRELFSRIAARLDAPDASLRASLVASQLAGLLIARHVLQLPAVAEASVDELVSRVGPTVQRHEPAGRERRRDRDGAPPRPHVRPVGGLVQIPCIERNAIAASTAVTAARLALAAHSFVVSERAAISTLHARVLTFVVVESS